MVYLENEFKAVVDAEVAYLTALEKLQAECDHPVVLKTTTSDYKTHRVCEDCGYHESVQWDSPMRYKDQRLVKRAYDVSWSEYIDVTPRLQRSTVDYHLKNLSATI